ncbi:MAG: tRNA (N6-isopentenyl adenosine(37)-C2)-methylthiotransferase MiaB [Oscillospiraceae bacterium]|nr:tRNA (N6-isopentenyl adenosine(37)-C2)-methylthiotransferase MiaB [Oscillospiraceae bacterium]
MERPSNNTADTAQSLLEEQRVWCAKIRDIAASRSKNPLAYVDTYGCQQNESDSEKLRGMLIEMGYGMTYDEYSADVVIVNTCAIREHAENRVLGNVGELVHTKKAKKSQVIVFCGCLAAVSKTVDKVRSSYEHVSLVFPPNKLWKFPELLYRALVDKKRIFETDDENAFVAEGLPTHRDHKVKAWLPIMYGCDNFCSYCIVPYVRGRERSRRAEAVISEASSLVAAQYKDITLLGQNVNSYTDPASNCASGGLSLRFPALLKKLSDISGDFLLRFMTSHPKDAGAELFEAMAQSGKIAKHIHLPFQAGSDRILKLMNRGYTAREYLDKINLARSLMPDIVITSDVIVGFPGETNEEVNETIALVEAAEFDAMFTFIYSARPGTPAAKLQDTVSKEEKHERFDRVVTLQNEISEKKHAQYIGKTLRVLVDSKAPGEAYPFKARSNGGRLVHLQAPPEQDGGNREMVGEFVFAKITQSNNWSLYGELYG